MQSMTLYILKCKIDKTEEINKNQRLFCFTKYV